MTEAIETAEQQVPKRSRLHLILGIVLALAGGGGGFYAVYSGMIFSSEEVAFEEDVLLPEPSEKTDDLAFVQIDPIIISLPPGGTANLIRFAAQLEVDPKHQRDVEKLLPRVIDVMNSYLRAVEPADLQKPGALVVLRAQILRRVQIVTGSGRVRDLLIMEFVLT